MPGLIHEVAASFRDAGVDLVALGRAWARAMPTVTIVPAFGLSALPLPARGVIGLALAMCVFPARASVPGEGPWVAQLVGEALRGLPIAVGTAAVLWAAVTVGGMLDNLRGAQDAVQVPVVQGRATTMSVPFALLAGAIWLSTGGPARVAHALSMADVPSHPLLRAANDLTTSIALAVSIGAPLLAASLVIEITGAVIARAASPAQIHLLLAPLRAIGLLTVCGIVFDRIAAVLAIAVRAR